MSIRAYIDREWVERRIIEIMEDSNVDDTIVISREIKSIVNVSRAAQEAKINLVIGDIEVFKR
jgi:hypothetical protein